MQVVRDEPGRLIHLEHVGARLTRRQGWILLILGAFWAGPAVVTFAALSKPGGGFTWQGICALVVWYGLLLPISVSVFRRTRHTQAVRVDLEAGTWTLVERRLGSLQEESQQVPSATIESFCLRRTDVVWSIVPGAIAFELWLVPLGKKLHLELEWVDRFEEVLDLAFRLGLASGMTRFRVARCTLRELEVEVSREGAVRSEPIPCIDAPADYEQDVSAAEAMVPRPSVGLFTPGAWNGPFRLDCWEPGRLISFRVPANYAALGCLTAIFSPFVLLGLMPLWEGIEKGDTGALSFSAMWYAILFAMLSAVGRGSRGSAAWIDWGKGTLRARSLLRTRTAPLDEVRRIDVVGVRWQESEGENGPTYNKYKCQVLAVCRDGDSSTRSLRLTETQGAREDPETPYRAAWSLGQALAEALQVPARYKDYR